MVTLYVAKGERIDNRWWVDVLIYLPRTSATSRMIDLGKKKMTEKKLQTANLFFSQIAVQASLTREVILK